MATAIRDHVVKIAVLEACTRAHVAHDSPLAAQLQSEAELAEGPGTYVRTAGGLSLDARIAELARVPKFASSLPTPTPSVMHTDLTALSEETFNQIASGKVVVK